ncbi:MAG: serine/threonine protein kinase [Lachnospiraceae bacterium]|nr:serine/threonine protein kinase [Lachnospiraceae bacterium]
MGQCFMAETDRTNIGKYIVLKFLGRGGEGSVYLARDEDLQRMVAVKQMGENMQEADWLKRLRHPMLPIVYELLWDKEWYLIMEYIGGVTLHSYIERNGFVQEEQTLEWAQQLLDVTEYLHTRKPPVIYRDLKPDNIMVCPDGHLRLVDFGAASVRNYGAKENIIMAATQGYAAPEQFGRTGQGAYADERSDIYALGKVIYYMMTGADPAIPPYASLPVHDYQPLADRRLERIIHRCIEENPAYRYQTVAELRMKLARCGGRRYRLRRRAFIRGVEKKIWLTEM